MENRWLLVKQDGKIKMSKQIDDLTYEKLKTAAESLAVFNTLTFLASNYVKAKEDFFAYDFTQFNVREVDMFNMFLNALESMSTNRNLWEAYLKRHYRADSIIYPNKTSNGLGKSCFGLKDSEYYDKDIIFVVAKVLRDMIAHHCKPYSMIVYDDDMCRQFLVTREDLLNLGQPNASQKKFINSSQHDYYNIVDVIKHSFEIVDEINEYVFNVIAQKEWPRFVTARYVVREYIGIDWHGAYLVKSDPRYPEEHLLYLSQIEISKNAMDSIGSLAARSLLGTTS